MGEQAKISERYAVNLGTAHAATENAIGQRDKLAADLERAREALAAIASEAEGPAVVRQMIAVRAVARCAKLARECLASIGGAK